MIEQHSDEIFDCMARMKGDGQPFALATVVRTEDATAAKAGAKAVVRADGSMVGWVGGGCTLGALRKAAAQALLDGQARLISVRPKARLNQDGRQPGVEIYKSNCPSGGTIEIFVEPMLPRPPLVILGASPVARALSGIGQRAGFAVTVAARAGDHELFENSDFRIEGYDLASVPAAQNGFLVVATQGRQDRDALAAALASGASYVAFVGSRRKAEVLKAAMRDKGLPSDRVDALRSPAGLDIGATTPEEIALSILAEIVAERRALARHAGTPAVEIEEVDDTRIESRVVSPAAGGCQGNDGKH